MKKLTLRAGVVTGDKLKELYKYCKEVRCALPAMNVIGSSSINAGLYAAKQANSPIILQFSNGGGVFQCWKIAG